MLRELQLSLLAILLLACGFLYQFSLRNSCLFCLPSYKSQQGPAALLSAGHSIVFLETSERTEPSPLASCAVESASRIYPTQPVFFFMKGLNDSTRLPPNSTHRAFSLLSALGNVFLFPLDMKRLFEDTPLFSWYMHLLPDGSHTGFIKVPAVESPRATPSLAGVGGRWMTIRTILEVLEDGAQVDVGAQTNWLHVSSDAARLAVIWKHGGIYMDTDIISIRPIPAENFLAAQASQFSSNGVFGFLPHHPFLWACMENFVEHYDSEVWGKQGPDLMSRMLRVWCRLGDFQEVNDLKCSNLSFLHPQRFYPIPFLEWKRYYDVWDTEPNFNYSYALHLWNHMNKDGRTVVRGSNTLVENLYRKYCPQTYSDLLQGPGEPVTQELGPGNK